MQLTIGLPHFLVLAVLLFGCGFFCVITRRNAVGLLMGVELILNSANVNLVAFNRYLTTPEGTPVLSGQIFTLFVIVLAAAEAAVALAIVLAVFRTFRSVDVGDTTTLKQ